MNFPDPSGHQLQQRVDYKAGGDADAEIVGENHQNNGDKRRYPLGVVIEVNVGDGADHLAADHDQGRAVGVAGDGGNQGSAEKTGKKKQPGGYGRKACTAAGLDPGR